MWKNLKVRLNVNSKGNYNTPKNYRRQNLALQTFSDSGKQQCVHFASEGHGFATIWSTIRICNKSQNQFNLIFRADIKIIKQGAIICTSVTTLSLKLANGEKKENNVFKRRSLCWRFAAIDIVFFHTSIWTFLRWALILFPFQWEMHCQISDRNKIKKIDFAWHRRGKLKNELSALRTQLLFSDQFHFSFTVQLMEQNFCIRDFEHPCKEYRARRNASFVTLIYVLSYNERNEFYLFRKKDVTRLYYKTILCYYMYLRLQNYPTDRIFQHDDDSSIYAVQLHQF